jgi:hypothetical protein
VESEWQPMKHESQIATTEEGIKIERSEEQLENDLAPICRNFETGSNSRTERD